MPSDDVAGLIRAATIVRDRAHAPFSRFKVGAAVEAADGTIVTGCNVESASYGLTICAERVAIAKAVSEGVRDFRRIVIVTTSPVPTSPCGACRQLLWELAGDLEVVLASPGAEHARYRLSQLLPYPFDHVPAGP